jgi:hypothetical protein
MRKAVIIAVLAMGLSGCKLHWTPCITPQKGWDYRGSHSQEWWDENGKVVGYSRQEDTCIVPFRINVEEVK